MTRKYDAGAFKRIKRAKRGQPYLPDEVELMYNLDSYQTEDGYLTQGVVDANTYTGTGVTSGTYTYLATGRFFSTAVSPEEYGDGSSMDALLMILYTNQIPEDMLQYIHTGAVVRLTRTQYGEPGALYRLVTGNPYPNHTEYKLVPLPL